MSEESPLSSDAAPAAPHPGEAAAHVINQRIFDTSPDLILVVDRQGTFIRISPSAMAILGYHPDELVGRSATPLVYPEDLDSTRNEMRLARRGRVTRNFECRYVHKDGRVVTLNWTGVWSEPEQQHFFIGRDITALKEAERRLHEVQRMDALLREGIDSMPEGFAIYDREDRLIICNTSYRHMFPTVNVGIAPGVRFETMLRDGQIAGMYPDAAGREEEWIAERLHQHREVSGTVEERLSDGRRLFIINQKMTNGCTAALRIDITPLKEAQQALENSERSFRYVFENSPLPMWVHETESLRFLAANHAAVSMYGFSRDEFLAMNISDIAASGEIGRMMQPTAEAPSYLQTGGWRHHTKDGRILDVDIFSHALDFDGKSARMVVAIDVTARKTAEAQLAQAQKMEAVGNLTGGMAHDFNNLLGIIIGNLDLLRDRQTADREAAELTSEALDAAVRGADLTARLLAFARRQPLQPQRTDLNRLVAGISNLLKRTLGEHVEITLQLGADVWPVVADPAQLESSLANLATNARDAMPRGGHLIIVTSNRHLDADYAAQHAEVTPGDYAMIEVTDTGIGILPEIAGHIFEPFYTTKEQGKGSGLGLSMVFGFMKQSGGHINLYSEVGIGTTFRLYLPRAASGAEAVAAPPPEPLVRGTGETVLAVEDNTGLRRVVVRQLSELGYRVFEAEDAQAALRVLESERVDLLFTDIVMPGGTSGYDLAHIAQSRWPELKVLLTSGFPEAHTNGNGSARNLRLFSKPYRRDDLGRVIREMLNA